MPSEPWIPFEKAVAEERRDIGIDPSGQPASALCISGGGIRSATFGLGALQGLADAGVLECFDYLSTVSGGGYIGAWLTAWKHRERGLKNVVPRLQKSAPKTETGQIDPIGHLRSYNSYLSPRAGLLSADVWTLVATVSRNMALNWLVLIPLLMVVLMLPRLVLSLSLLHNFYPGVIPEWAAAPLGLISAALMATAVVNAMRYLPGVGAKDHTDHDFLRHCLAPLVVSSLGFMTYDSWFDPSNYDDPTAKLWEMLAWIASSFFIGWTTYLLFWANEGRRDTRDQKKKGRRLQLLSGPMTIAVILLGVGTTVGAWLLVTKVYTEPSWPVYVTVGPPLLLLAFLGAGGIFVGLTSRFLSDEDREWLSRGTAWVLLSVIGWIGVCGLVLIVPTWVIQWGRHLSTLAKSSIAAADGVVGGICSLAGYATRYLPENSRTVSKAGWKRTLTSVVANLAAPVFLASLFVGISILTDWILGYMDSLLGYKNPYNSWINPADFVDYTTPAAILATCLVLGAIGLAAGWFVDINRFSLHAMYRSRLIRAYLGASNKTSPANHFIGFNENDNVFMSQLDSKLRPFHIVNITLNLTGGKNLAWQQRKAESFTVSPLHAGSFGLGYRPSGQYAGRNGISLGSAITISGAAASPNMGYHSTGAISFIMMLFNARLGAWLGNPGHAGEKTWKDDGPKFAIRSLVKEAFGLTDDSSPYVYLSDGGHFENLGLYEMIRRGVTRIVVLDSGCDPKFVYEDLGNALRKIRIDTGVTIEFEDEHIELLRQNKKRCAIAKIRYSDADSTAKDGLLLYIKPMMTGNEPPDVASYHASYADFPHESTANQWYNESQTESYRMLGVHTLQEICSGWQKERTGDGLDGLFRHVETEYLGRKAWRAGAS